MARQLGMISHPSLTPKTDLSPDDMEMITVKGLGSSCIPGLLKSGWKNLATGTIGLNLAADNARVLTANLYLLGRLHKTDQECTSAPVSKFWPNMDPKIELRLPLDKLQQFMFDATLHSGYVDSSAVPHEFVNTDTDSPVSLDEFKALGGSGFCLRAFTHMTTGIWLKLQIGIYPMAKADLMETFPYAKNVLFPGLQLVSRNISMLPSAKMDYGLPFLPFVQKGSDAPFPQVSSFAIRTAMTALLQTGVTPKMSKDASYLANKWQKLRELGTKGEDSLTASSTAAATWPDALPSPDPDLVHEGSDLEGKYLKFSLPNSRRFLPERKNAFSFLYTIPRPSA